MEKVKVAYIIPSLDVGGSEYKVIELAKGLDKTKYEPIIITITKEGVLKELANSFNIPVFNVSKKSKFDILVIRRIKKLLKNENVSIVQTFTSTGKLWGRLGAIRAKTKVIISTEESLFRGSKLDLFLEKRFIKKTSAIICNSNSTKESAISCTNINEDKYHVIYNGINVDKFISNKVKALKDPVKLIVVARLDKRKGLDLLIESLNLINKDEIDFTLDILGEGSEYDNLVSLINKYKLTKKVNLLGFKNNTNEYLDNSDIFVLPSREEGFGNVVIEAFASKTPVIVSNSGGLSELVNDNVNGLVFENDNFHSLYLKLKELILNKELRSSLSNEAFKNIDKYRSNVMVLKHEELYEKLLGGKK